MMKCTPESGHYQSICTVSSVGKPLGGGGEALREEIHESTISLRFLGIILGYLRLKGSTFVFAFLQNSIYEKIQFSSLVDGFVWISETKGVVWFSVRFSTFGAFLNVASMGKKCIYIKIKCNKRKNGVTFKRKKEKI
jgi:hypothetical protein